MKRVSKLTNVIAESVYVQLSTHTHELKPGETIRDVVVCNENEIRPYVKMIENLTEINPV